MGAAHFNNDRLLFNSYLLSLRRFCLLSLRCFPHIIQKNVPQGLLRYHFHTGALALLVNTKMEQSEPAHDPLTSQSTGSSAQHYVWRDTLSEPKRCSLPRCEIVVR